MTEKWVSEMEPVMSWSSMMTSSSSVTLATMWLPILVLCLVSPSSPYMSSYCYFNQLCTCKLQAGAGDSLQNVTESVTPVSAIQSLLQAPVDIRDVSCLGVPFAQIPGKSPIYYQQTQDIWKFCLPSGLNHFVNNVIMLAMS